MFTAVGSRVLHDHHVHILSIAKLGGGGGGGGAVPPPSP